MRRFLPLWVQLVLIFVGLVAGTVAVLSALAYTSLRTNLDAEARRSVSMATLGREQTLTSLFQLRQQRAEGFVASVESLCAEPVGRRLGWVDDCVATMLRDFRVSERALGASLLYRNRRIATSGDAPAAVDPPAGAIARVRLTAEGVTTYVMRARLGATSLLLEFDHGEVAQLFAAQVGPGRGADAALVETGGHLLTAVPRGRQVAEGPHRAPFLENCRTGAEGLVGPDEQGRTSFQSFRPVPVLGTACVVASLGYEDVLAPAEQVRADLVARGVWFGGIGAVLSLAAAAWIATPIRRLARAARALQKGGLERPIRLAGPPEVRALGKAFNTMAGELADLVARERAARLAAEDASRSKDEFLATVSHELRTPLNAIMGWAQMLRANRLSPEQARHGIAVIERSARSQSRLIDDLLDVSRIVSRGLHIVREPVPMAEIVEAALDGVRPDAAAKQVTLSADLAGRPVVMGDARRLEQVVWNLVSNAVKFTPAGGEVSVALRVDGPHLVLVVSDSGIGISPSFLPHVFDWFRQEDPRSLSQAGLGLGLGIVRHIVQMHGGEVTAESEGAGRGATFTVTLPVFKLAGKPVQDARDAALGAPLLVLPDLRTTRVLVVEDDADARDVVRTTLEHAGASVEVAESAGDARRTIMADAPDVLISDIRMPGEDGYSLMRSLRGAGISTPAIALTAHARREDADAAYAAGFQVHMAKPVDAAQLVEAVATLVRSGVVH